MRAERDVARIYRKDMWYYTYMDSYRNCLFNAEKSPKMMKYLEQYDELRFKQCIIDEPKSLEGSFRRKKLFPKDVFTDAVKLKINSMVRKLN